VETTLVGLLTCFYHNFPAVNKKILWVLGDGFIDTEAEGLFTIPIVVRKREIADSSTAHQ
jgi:hypothetical protein